LKRLIPTAMETPLPVPLLLEHLMMIIILRASH
jgi:hypothetical protein